MKRVVCGVLMNDGYYLSGRKGDTAFTVNGTALTMAGWRAEADSQSFFGLTVTKFKWRNVFACVAPPLQQMQHWPECGAQKEAPVRSVFLATSSEVVGTAMSSGWSLWSHDLHGLPWDLVQTFMRWTFEWNIPATIGWIAKNPGS